MSITLGSTHVHSCFIFLLIHIFLVDSVNSQLLNNYRQPELVLQSKIINIYFTEYINDTEMPRENRKYTSKGGFGY